MLSPSCMTSRFATRQPCPRAKGKVFGSILVTLIMFGSTIARCAEPPGEYHGVLDGAQYVIAVPPKWNSGLVMFAHGYQAEGSGSGLVSREPLDHYLTNHGYAWASSGYRSKGYRPDLFLLDLLALRAQFIERFGQPRWTIIHGQSMGGHVAIASLELHPEVYQGGLIECGIVDGVGLVDWLYAYTAAAEYFSGLPLLETFRPEFDKLTSVEFLKADGRTRPLHGARATLRQCRQAPDGWRSAPPP